MVYEQERVPAAILGKEIGTMSGWDQADTMAVQFYDFKPNDLGVAWLKNDPAIAGAETSCITVDFDTGKVTCDAGDDDSGIPSYIEQKVDWSVFNE